MAYRLILILVSTLPQLAILNHAQQADHIELEFKIFGVGKDSYQGLYFYNGERYQELIFHRTHRSFETYKYQGPPIFSVFVRNPQFSALDPLSNEFVQVARLRLDQKSFQSLFVFSAGEENRKASNTERRFQIFQVNDEPAYFTRNTITIVNATGADLFGKIADEELALPVGVSPPIDFDGIQTKRRTTTLAFALETSFGPKLVMSNDLRLSDDRRILLILEPPRRPNSLRIAARMLTQSHFMENESINN